MSAYDPNPIIGEENTKIDKLGNTKVEEDDTDDSGPMTRHQLRNEQRKAQLGLAASPPDRKRGPDRGMQDNWVQSQGNESNLVAQEEQELPPVQDRQSDFTYNNNEKKTRQGWGDLIDAQTAVDEFDPNDPASEEQQNSTATSNADDNSMYKTLDEYHPESRLPKGLGRVEPRAPNSVRIDSSQEPKNATRVHESMDAR
ncbi:hypothetical protein BDB00DRAFT_849399 [Zychaea mexicana]|uniref:uncharacterized protein n=1 Tax=Zychaea mexicana TaxID=64656 RepID=UPI0022FE5504|nr:uncharacterized protein BDB00DRAFT_849399 [Zychaea mexicana]KAI9488220.1 hypothetical protein BDB00DRAFT_849399 [Zychaea mexicana]